MAVYVRENGVPVGPRLTALLEYGYAGVQSRASFAMWVEVLLALQHIYPDVEPNREERERAEADNLLLTEDPLVAVYQPPGFFGEWPVNTRGSVLTGFGAVFSFAPASLLFQMEGLTFPPILRQTVAEDEEVTSNLPGLHPWSLLDVPWPDGEVVSREWQTMVAHWLDTLRAAGEDFFDSPTLQRMRARGEVVVGGRGRIVEAPEPVVEARAGPSRVEPAPGASSSTAGGQGQERHRGYGRRDEGTPLRLEEDAGVQLEPEERPARARAVQDFEHPPIATLRTPEEVTEEEIDELDRQYPSPPPLRRRSSRRLAMAQNVSAPAPAPPMAKARSQGESSTVASGTRTRTTRAPERGVPTPLTGAPGLRTSASTSGLKLRLRNPRAVQTQPEEEAEEQRLRARQPRRPRRVESEEQEDEPAVGVGLDIPEFGHPVLLTDASGRGE